MVPTRPEFFQLCGSTIVTDAYVIAASQDIVYRCLVPVGVIVSEGFDYGGSLSSMGCSMLRSAGSTLYGESEYNASASHSIGLWEDTGRGSRGLSMESCLEAMSTVRGEGLSVREPRSRSSMSRQRGAIGRSHPYGTEILWQK